MTRMISIAGVVAALAAAATISIGAQPPQGRGSGGGRMGPGGPGPGGPVPILRGLDLSDAQRDQIRTITEAQRGKDGGPPKLADLQRQLQLAVFGETVDQAKVDELRAALGAAQAEELARRIDVESRIAQVLTVEQRAQAREKLSTIGPPNGPPPGGRRGRGRL